MKQSDIDIEMIKGALKDETKKSQLMEVLTPLVDAIIEHYKDYDVTKEELRDISWSYLDFALKKYTEKFDKRFSKKEDLYKFSTYFSWYIKTSIETYLGISEEPLKGIQPKEKRPA